MKPYSLYRTPEQIEFDKALERLDSVSRDYEARWGIGRLDMLVPADMLAKWQRQWVLLNEAIESNLLVKLAPLVEGTIRGWAAMEAAAIKEGHAEKAIGEAWGVVVDGQEYLVVKNVEDTRRLANGLNKGVAVLLLEELVRVFKHRHDYVNRLERRPEDELPPPLPESFWKAGGDKVEFK